MKWQGGAIWGLHLTLLAGISGKENVRCTMGRLNGVCQGAQSEVPQRTARHPWKDAFVFLRSLFHTHCKREHFPRCVSLAKLRPPGSTRAFSDVSFPIKFGVWRPVCFGACQNGWQAKLARTRPSQSPGRVEPESLWPEVWILSFARSTICFGGNQNRSEWARDRPVAE